MAISLNKYLHESLLDDEDDLIENDPGIIYKDDVLQNLKDLTDNDWSRYDIKIEKIDNNIIVDLNKAVLLIKNDKFSSNIFYKNITYLRIYCDVMKNVGDVFKYCDYIREINIDSLSFNSLKGLPNCGVFALRGGPQFTVFDNPNMEIYGVNSYPSVSISGLGVTSLKDMPIMKGNKLYIAISNCKKLTSISDLQNKIKASISDLFILDNPKLTSLNGCPDYCSMFNCSNCGIIDLQGCPQHIEDFYCEENKKLITLKGGPQDVQNAYHVNKCLHLESLEGCPKIVKSFSCNKTGIHDLVGAPEKITNTFSCSYCYSLSTIEGTLKECKNFTCKKSPIKEKEDEIKSLIKIKGKIKLN